MKRKILYFVLPLLVFIACSDEFTETPAVGALSPDALANEAGIELLLTGAYSALDGIVIGNGGNGFAVSPDNWWFDVLADDAHKGSTDGDQADLFAIETYTFSTANPYILGRWEALYGGANRSNAVIAAIQNLESVDLSNKEGEARFLRAYYNMELQKIYGNPAFISVENYTNTEFNQPNPGPIWAEIESDLQFAIDNLPASQADAGRPSSWTAKAFMGKTLLFQEKWSEALSILQDVINNGPYALNEEFVANFTAAGENGSESVFAIQFTADGTQSFNGNVGGTLNFPGGGPFGSCCGFYQPTQDLVNAYQVGDDGLPLLYTFNDTDVANDYGLESGDSFATETAPLDPRLDYTVGRRGIDYNGYGINPGKEWIRASAADISGPYLPKKNIYFNGEDVNVGTGAWGQQHSGVNYNVMRFADVLLMAAEAAVETNDLNTALDYVNMVRNRAKNMTYVQNEAGDGDAANYQIEPYTSFSDQQMAIDAVRFEKRLELAMEGHRFFDLARWDIAVETLNEYVENESRTISNFGPKANTFQPYMAIMPIPLNAIDLSGGILQQNPGY